MKPSLKLIGAICLLFISQAVLEGFFMTILDKYIKITFMGWEGNESFITTLIGIFGFHVLIDFIYFMIPYIIIIFVIIYWIKHYTITFISLIVFASLFLITWFYFKNGFSYNILNPLLGMLSASLVLIIIEKKYPQLFAVFYEK